MSPVLGALILFSQQVDAVVAFYRALGVALETEVHDGAGTVHYATDLGDVHVAVYESPPGAAPRWREGGSACAGFCVDDLASALDAVRSLGAKIIAGPEERPWGQRAIVEDPDGRPVELWSGH